MPSVLQNPIRVIPYRQYKYMENVIKKAAVELITDDSPSVNNKNPVWIVNARKANWVEDRKVSDNDMSPDA